MAEPNQAAIKAALQTNHRLGVLFNQVIGTRAHPRGRILNAYRKARTDLQGNVNKAAGRTVLQAYRQEVYEALTDGLQQAVAIGRTQAKKNAEALGLTLAAGVFFDQYIRMSVEQIMATIDGQILAITSGLLTEAQILGGQSGGLFLPGGTQQQAANKFANLALLAFTLLLVKQAETGPFVKQAVAVLDASTTLCCRAVDGQTQELNALFVTPEPPAFARRQERPPFHFHCRTSVAIILREGAQPS